MSCVQAGLVAARRLDLVPLRPEHAGEMAAVLAVPGLYAFTGGSPPRPEELRDRYDRWSAGSPDPDTCWLNWVLHLREQQCLVGTVQATVTSGEDGRVAEIAWIVGRPWQRRGFATEAARALVDWLRTQPVHRVVAHIHPDHAGSVAVAAAAGLHPTDRWHEGERTWQLALDG